MEFTYVAASITGVPEHDKFAIEIARKNSHLAKIYNEVEVCIKNVEGNSGYSEINDMVDELKKVQTELALMSNEMQKTMNDLES